MSNNKRLFELRKLIKKYDFAYYTGNTLISDREYDKMKEELKGLEIKEYGTFEEKIGVDLTKTGFKKADHLIKMFSLEKCYSFPELKEFIDRCEKKVLNFWPVWCEVKIDGLAISLLYQKGLLVRAVTRGDGVTGEDLTQQSLRVLGIPQKINYFQTIEVKGEVYMKKKDFQNCEGKFANARTAACGSMRQIDSSITQERKLCFLPYDYFSSTRPQTQFEIVQNLLHYGFEKVEHSCLCRNLVELNEFYEKIKSNREKIPYDIDGVVYKVNSIETQHKLGFNSHAPKFAIAHKFSSTEGITKIEKVIFQMGKNGIITPIGILSPVNLGGTVVSRVNLYNKDFIKEKNISVGGKVVVKIAGDIIPQVARVISSTQEEIIWPDNCFECNEKLRQDKAYLRCPNYNCDIKRILRIQHFCKTLKIQNLGYQRIQFLYRKKYFQEPMDVLSLTKTKMSSLLDVKGWGEKLVCKILNEIQSVQFNNIPLEKYISALSIEHVGKSVAILISDYCQGDLKTFHQICQSGDKRNILGIGEKTWKSLFDFGRRIK